MLVVLMLRRSALSVVSRWGPLGDAPPISNKTLLGPCQAPKGTITTITTALIIIKIIIMIGNTNHNDNNNGKV